MEHDEFKERSFSLADGMSRKKAQRNLKTHLDHVEVMKNRLRVISSQADYNKYRQNYQNQKIQRHHKIHQEIVKNREEVDRACKSFDNSEEKRENSIKMRMDIRERLGEAYTRLKQQKLQESNEIRMRSKRYSQVLTTKKKQQFQDKRARKQYVKHLEYQIRESISRFHKEKQQDLKTVKDLQKQGMCQLTGQVTKQLQELSSKEKELIILGSESIKASRLKNQQYQDLYGIKTQNRIHLPGITLKATDKHSQTAITE